MPGLNQLKRFNQDMLAIGDEAKKRAARGEKPITVPIPATVKDADDSDDFALGMPEGVSDMNGGVAMPNAEASSVDVPEGNDSSLDVSGLLDGVDNASADEIDFSQFEEMPPLEPLADGGTSLNENYKAADDLFDADESNADENNEARAGGEDASGILDAEPLETAEPLEELEPMVPEADEAILDANMPDALDAEPVAEAETVDEAETLDEVEPVTDAEPVIETESNDAELFDDAGEISMNEQFPQGLDNVIPDAGQLGDEEIAEAAPAETPSPAPSAPAKDDDFNVDDLLSGIDFGDEGGVPPADEIAAEEPSAVTEEAASAQPLEEAAPVETPSPAPSAPAKDDDFNVDDLLSGIDFGGEAAVAEADAVPDTSNASGVSSEESAADNFDLGTDDASNAAPAVDAADESAAGKDALSGLDLNMDDANGNASSSGIDIGDALSGLDFGNLDDGESNAAEAPIETFNAPEMEGVDFTADSKDSGFELDDDALHIPGFTDTETAADVHGKSTKAAEEKRESPENNGLPPNTLTDTQYEKFKDNFSQYPLNVRQAFENMVVQNEFTDDAQFEVVGKVLKKSSARHVASHLEKMLDISIPVPRDFEKRTASEYAAYKSSFKYQLYNRIIPAALVCLAGVLLAVGLFMFARKFIYKPIVAHNLYKQGYTLLEADEYPQSESRFVEATKYKMVKKWFYKYANGYRERKQYQRAEKMYRNILYCFNHDKQAGIEYAQMECYDLANYEKAEEIARREVLDYHINDSDGILLLGDVLLEWGTEKDPSKFEEAKKQYALLMQLYKPNDLYMSRMMRYFIRTDNLREVLSLKEHFYTNRKAKLGSDDWTELSGFMLDKLYGPLSPMDEELRIRVEDVMDMLRRAVRADPTNPVAMYNLSRYYVKRNSSEEAKSTLTHTIELFDSAQRRSSRDMYRELDTYRLLGEEYSKARDYIKAQEIYTDGITLYEKEKRNNGFQGGQNVGRLYADAGDIDYFIRGNMESAFNAYNSAIETDCDTPSLRYRLGYIHYNKGDYDGAVDSFIKTSEETPNDIHLLLAMANTLSLRGDNYGAQSYYQRLVNELDVMRAQKGILLPQVRGDQAEIVEMYLKASNNLGVTLGRLARRTGNSLMNADAMVNLTTSMRAYDALTRNQTTMVRLPGSNLAEQNLQYMTRPESEFEPAIYTSIPRILTTEKELHQ